LGGFRGIAEKCVDLLLVDLDEGLDHHITEVVFFLGHVRGSAKM
jgi:hypothetical protein